jgi:uncharacterized protein
MFDAAPVPDTVVATQTGYYDLLDPTEDQVVLENIIQTLPRLPRWGGRGARFFSVGEHLMLCDSIARASGFSIEDRRAICIHDWHEALISGDMVSPAKRIIGSRTLLLEGMEAQADHVIRRKFGVTDAPEAVRFCDQMAAGAEWLDLFPNHGPYPGPCPGDPSVYSWAVPRFGDNMSACRAALRNLLHRLGF